MPKWPASPPGMSWKVRRHDLGVAPGHPATDPRAVARGPSVVSAPRSFPPAAPFAGERLFTDARLLG